MVTHERGEERDLERLESAQLPVLDQVGRVPVVSPARHMLADVVQQGGELEHLAVARAELMEVGSLVEQSQGKVGDVRGVRDVGVATPGEARDRRAP